MEFKKLTCDTALNGDFGSAKKNEFEKFKTCLAERQLQYPIQEFHDDTNLIVDEVKENGFTIIKNFFNKDELMDLKNEVDDAMNKGLLQKSGFAGSIDGTNAEIRDKCLFYAINQPLLSLDNVFNIIFRDDLISIAAHYYKCLPACVGFNLRRSYANNISEDHTQLYHQDDNSPDFFKMFIYLNDVDINGGPFNLIKGSHRNKFDGCYSKYRWGTDEINSIYGDENVVYATANFGDLVLATTNAFHRGTKPKTSDRTMLTIDWQIHPPYFRSTWGEKIKKKDYDLLPDWKKPIADYLVKE